MMLAVRGRGVRRPDPFFAFLAKLKNSLSGQDGKQNHVFGQFLARFLVKKSTFEFQN